MKNIPSYPNASCIWGYPTLFHRYSINIPPSIYDIPTDCHSHGACQFPQRTPWLSRCVHELRLAVPLQRFPRHWAGGSTYVEENIKPHLLRNIWTPSIEKYLNHSESKFGYVLNVWTNLGPSTVLYVFQNQFEPTLASSVHCGKSWKPSTRLSETTEKPTDSGAEWQGQQVANMVAHLGKFSENLLGIYWILIPICNQEVGFGWWMIGEWPPNESSAKSYHVISRLPKKK